MILNKLISHRDKQEAEPAHQALSHSFTQNNRYVFKHLFKHGVHTWFSHHFISICLACSPDIYPQTEF